MSVATLKPWHLSLLVHVTMVLAFASLTFLKLPEPDVYEVPIEVNAPQEVQNLTEVKEKPNVVLRSVNEPVPDAKPSREVFGANRNSYTDETQGTEGVEIKKGNTLAKEVDNTKLEDSDAETLPTPTEEYLVSEMPSVLSEVRPIYPKEAREKQLQGKVALDVLIDEKGLVRQVKVIEGLENFQGSAITAMKNYKFRPAKVDGKAVAVRIRYSINFQLEY
jgi:TonB family protein